MTGPAFCVQRQLLGLMQSCECTVNDCAFEPVCEAMREILAPPTKAKKGAKKK
jgi:hypothetical protein